MQFDAVTELTFLDAECILSHEALTAKLLDITPPSYKLKIRAQEFQGDFP